MIFKILLWKLFLKFLPQTWSAKTYDRYHKVKVGLGIIYNDGCPKICEYCGSENLDEIIRDTINYMVCEKDIVCKGCGKLVGQWAYGSYSDR